MSMAVWLSDSVLGFSSVVFGGFWVSGPGLDAGAVAGVVVLVSGGCLAAVGAYCPPPLPAGGFCVWG